jgi:hypothetical protein
MTENVQRFIKDIDERNENTDDTPLILGKN